MPDITTCRCCGIEKRTTEFYGAMTECKLCNIERVKQIRLANPARHVRNTNNWNARNPEKVAARTMIQSALKNGTIIKEACATCGSIEKIEGHHPDYDKPDEVVWLCPSCHKHTHVLMRRGEHEAVRQRLAGHYRKIAA